MSGSIPVEEQAKAAASWAALDMLEKTAHAFGQMPGSLLGQFSLSRAWFPSEGVKTALGAEEGAVLAHVFVLTSQWLTLLPSWVLLKGAAQTTTVWKQSSQILWPRFRKPCFPIF